MPVSLSYHIISFRVPFLINLFQIVYSDTSKLNKGIISESNVLGWLDCGLSCLEKNICVALNFKEELKENEINCQLTNTTDHKFERESADDNGWTFYEAVGERMVRIFNINLVKY